MLASELVIKEEDWLGKLLYIVQCGPYGGLRTNELLKGFCGFCMMPSLLTIETFG